MDSHLNSDLIGFSRGKTRSLAAERDFDSRAVHDARTDQLAVARNLPQTKLDTIQKPGAAQSAAESSAGQPEGRSSGDARESGVEASNASQDVTTAAITDATAPGLDDAQDLTELLNRLDSGSSLRAKR
jgi:hypothetical protein